MDNNSVVSNCCVIKGGPTLKELVDACANNTPVSFVVDPNSELLVVTVQRLMDLKRPGVDRWYVGSKTVEGEKEVCIYYTFPERRGLYFFE